MIDLHTATIVMRYYSDDDDAVELDGLAEVETNEGEVDLIVRPRTTEACSFSFSVEEAWRLSRELAKAATVAELGLDD